jgi:hypothetical protein
MPRRDKSFYVLVFSVEPGGAHKDTHYVRGTLDEIKSDLARELDDQLNLYLLCWYGARLELQVFERGELVRKADLHRAITIAIAGYPAITFAGPNLPIGHTFRGEEDVDGSLTQRMFAGSLEHVNVTVDWSKVDVPAALSGQIAGQGDLVNIDGGWQVGDDHMAYGALLDDGYLPYGFSDYGE